MFERLRHEQLPPLGPALEQPRHHVLDVDADLFDVAAADDLEGGSAGVAHVDLDGAVIEASQSELLSQPLAGTLRRIGHAGHGGVDLGPGARRQQQIEQPVFGGLPRLRPQFFVALVAHHRDRQLHQVADHRLDVAPDIADLGELRGLDLDERRLRQPRQPPRNLGLAHARGPDHQDVLRRDILGQLLGQFLPPHAIAQRNGHGALRFVLADDVLVEFGDDLARRQRFSRALRPFRQVNRHVCLQFLDDDLVVRVDADVGRNRHRVLGDRARRQRRVPGQRPRRGQRVRDRPSRWRPAHRRAESDRRCPTAGTSRPCRRQSASPPGAARRGRCANRAPVPPPSARDCPGYCSSLASKRENSAKESAAEPANPARIRSW